MESLQPSSLFLPCITSCNPYTQSISFENPDVAPYWSPWERSSLSMFRTTSLLGSAGERAVKFIDVNGKVDAFGFPARREMRPGVDSRGKRLRTGGGVNVT